MARTGVVSKAATGGALSAPNSGVQGHDPQRVLYVDWRPSPQISQMRKSTKSLRSGPLRGVGSREAGSKPIG
jgi:hypothetical protein